MKDRSRDVRALSALASMPFLDRLELAVVSGTPDRTMHDAVASLLHRGLVGSVRHATELIAPTTRFYVTAAGLGLLADVEGVTTDDFVRVRRVSAHMRRILLDRLDAVCVIYRLASSIVAASAVGRPSSLQDSPFEILQVILSMMVRLAPNSFVGMCNTVSSLRS